MTNVTANGDAEQGGAVASGEPTAKGGVATGAAASVQGSGRGDFLREVRTQMWLAGPLIAVNFLLYSLQVISVMFVGHLGELALASAAMATSFAGVTAFSLLVGMSSAMDTFCGQAYGAKQYHMLGVHLQRAMAVLSILCIPIALIQFYAGDILKLLRQNPQIADHAGVYARYLIPATFAYGYLQCHIRFLQCQNIVFPMMLASGLTIMLHFPLCWMLVFKSRLGNRGAAVALCVSYWFNLAALVVYVRMSVKCKETWVGFSKKAFKGLVIFTKLAIPSATMICLEFWSFEMVVLLAGLLPNPKLEASVLSICLTTSAMLFMIVSGISSAISVRVSNELGAGQSRTARLAVLVGVSLSVGFSIVVGVALVLVRKTWGKLYSNEEAIISYISKMVPILAGCFAIDGYQCALSGTARGCGWQKLGAFVNLGAYYMVGIPSGVIMAFVFHLGGKGLWLGIACALFVQSILLSLVALNTNWEKQATQAKQRAYDGNTPNDMRPETTSTNC